MRLRASAVLANSLFMLGFILFTTDLARAIAYTYTGSCTTNCAGIGLPAGGLVSGAITFTDGSLVGGNPYPIPISFFFRFWNRRYRQRVGAAIFHRWRRPGRLKHFYQLSERN